MLGLTMGGRLRCVHEAEMVKGTVEWCEKQLATHQVVDTRMLLARFCTLLSAEADRLVTIYADKPGHTKQRNYELEKIAANLLVRAGKLSECSAANLSWARKHLTAPGFRPRRPEICFAACVDFKLTWWLACLLSNVANNALSIRNYQEELQAGLPVE